MNIFQKQSGSLSHVHYSLVYCSLLFVAYNAINYDSIARWFTAGSGTDYASLFAYYGVGLSAFVLVFLLLAHRYTIRFLSVLLVVLSCAGAYFISKYDVAIDRTMLMNAFHTDPAEVHSLLSWQMIPYVLVLMALPIVLILRTRITFGKYYFLHSLQYMLGAIVLCLALVYSQFDGISRAGNISRKQIVHSLVPINFIQSLGSIVQNELKPWRDARRKKVSATGTVATQRDLMVVLAIGETSRQANFSVYGYQRRDTTPELAKIEGLHLLNGNAKLGSTLYALPQILTKDDVALPGFTTKLGIDTVCYVNFTLYDNCTVPGEVAVSNCAHGGTCYDEDVIPLLENKLKSYKSGPSLVVLHLGGGSHGPSYQERYPAEFQRFKPMCEDADVVNRCTKEQLYNSFDNTILYVDHVVASIINRLDAAAVPYVLIYLSDHGESLLEDGRIFHGMPPGIPLPPEQAKIPLIVKSSVPVDIKAREQYEQQDIFDTVLSLFSVSSTLHDEARSFITLKDAAAKE